MSPKRVALAVTSYNKPFYPDGMKTGAFFVEVLHPWEAFTKAGYDVDIVSETGTFGWDEHSLDESMASADELKTIAPGSTSPFAKAVANVKKASDVNPKDYDVFYAAGGHGTIFDFHHNAPGVAALAGAIYDHNGTVGAVCHGPVILGDVRDANGKLVAEGKELTGFPDSGEKAMGLDKFLDENHYLYTSETVKSLGHYVDTEADPFASKVVYDGRLATGANPASATPLAEAIIAKLG